jgi:hypothetical protein
LRRRTGDPTWAGFWVIGSIHEGRLNETADWVRPSLSWLLAPELAIDPDLLDRLRVGPLASHLDAYLKRIEQEGFLPSSVPMQMYAVARFSNWLQTSSTTLSTIRSQLQFTRDLLGP